MLVLCPRANRHEKLLGLDVDIPRVFQQSPQFRPGTRLVPEISHGLQQGVDPTPDRSLRGHSSVFGVVHEVKVLEFAVATWCGVLEALARQSGPVLNGRA